MTDSFEIFVQPGKWGMHAGGRGVGHIFAAHESDAKTAAWRCALKRWFPSRVNGVVLYDEAHAVTLETIGPNEFKATLSLDDTIARAVKWSHSFTPLLPVMIPALPKPTRKADRPLRSGRGVRGRAPRLKTSKAARNGKAHK
jgi:hypothetical protein